MILGVETGRNLHRLMPWFTESSSSAQSKRREDIRSVTP
jgi:hypothetical protein